MGQRGKKRAKSFCRDTHDLTNGLQYLKPFNFLSTCHLEEQKPQHKRIVTDCNHFDFGEISRGSAACNFPVIKKKFNKEGQIWSEWLGKVSRVPPFSRAIKARLIRRDELIRRD